MMDPVMTIMRRPAAKAPSGLTSVTTTIACRRRGQP